MNKKSIILYIASGFMVLFIVLLLTFLNGFLGNPISASIASSRIKKYVKHTYPDMDLEISDAKYNFKMQSYQSKIQSKTSKDTNFAVDYSKGAIYDSYEYDVTKRYKTYERLSMEFNKQVTSIIEDNFDYETSILFADFGKGETDIDMGKLVLDMPLDISNPPMPSYITAYILSNDVSYEFLSAILIELYQLMERKQIPIDLYTVVVEEPMEEGGKAAPEGEHLYLFDFPAEKISSEDLISVIKEHQEIFEAEHEK